MLALPRRKNNNNLALLLLRDPATVSASNFSAPAHLASEGSVIKLIEAENSEESHPPTRDVSPASSFVILNSRRMMDLDKQPTTSTLSTAGPFSAKQERTDGYDGMWDVFDMFSRIRIAFFRILLDSLGNLSGPEDEFPGRRELVAQPSVVELVSDAVKRVKSVSNEKGFMLIATAPLNEMSDVVNVIQREVNSVERGSEIIDQRFGTIISHIVCHHFSLFFFSSRTCRSRSRKLC